MTNTERKIIIFIGPEGSGKTTHATRLAEETGLLYLTTGGISRELAKSDPGPLGDECRATFAEHRYVDGNVLTQILLHRFKQEDTKNGFILDGGLRTYEETAAFNHMLEDAGRSLPVTVLLLQIAEEISLERLVYGENARKREDDSPEGVLSRLKKYHTKLDERLAVIKANPNWKLVEIDAAPPIEKVYETVVNSI